MSCRHYDHAAFFPKGFGCDMCTQEREARYSAALHKILARCVAFDGDDLGELVRDIVGIVKTALK